MHEGLKPCQFRQVDAHGRILCHLIKGADREVSVNLCRVCPVQQINCQHLRAGLEKHVSTPITVRFATGRVEVWDNDPPTIDFKQAACAAKTMPIHSPRDCAGCPIRLPNVVPQNAIQVAHRAKHDMPNALPQAAVSVTQAAEVSTRAMRNAPRAEALSQPVVVESNAAAEMVARAQATAARKAEERKAQELEQAAKETRQAATPITETKSKIIQMQQWLAEQLSKKQAATNPHQSLAVKPDADGVSEIVYSPISPAYHEDSG
ncbi:MAG TPA: hypothetical protein VFD70_01220, partial [Anaerolineae bacterium]|nr:hypothetical protein [Anaerolineae bacterium]